MDMKDARHDVICIEAKKVFDLCFQEERVERLFPITEDLPDAPIELDCQIDTENITCREVSPREKVDSKKGKFLVCLAIELPVTISAVNSRTGQLVCPVITHTVTVLKQVVLCAPEGTSIRCEVTGNCCCVLDRRNDQINCVFNLVVVIKSTATVQVLVPTLGMCAPVECKAVPGGVPPTVPKDCVRDCD